MTNHSINYILPSTNPCSSDCDSGTSPVEFGSLLNNYQNSSNCNANVSNSANVYSPSAHTQSIIHGSCPIASNGTSTNTNHNSNHNDLHGAASSNNGLKEGLAWSTTDTISSINKDVDSHDHAISETVKASVHDDPDQHKPTMPTTSTDHDTPPPAARRPTLWYEEEIDENLRWCFGLKSILHTGVSKFQEIALLDTQAFGKVLTLDRKMQSAEVDEWVYHECLVHPALLLHQSPKNIFIMGGGEGSTAREVLKHKSIKKVVMCDIDEEVVKFCSACLTINHEAFHSTKLELVINDARLELECRKEKFDIIVGDLADPLEWGPCYQLYSKGFYETVVKPKLNEDGIFVTQAGPAGVLSHKEVFTSIYNTLKQVFSYVIAYSAHVPSYADTWGWVMASNQPLNAISHHDEMDTRIQKRIKGELQYLDGATLHASTILNKAIRQSLASEKHIYTEDSARFLYGHGRNMHISTH